MNDTTKTFDQVTAEDIKNALADENIVRDSHWGLPVLIIDGDEYAVAATEQEAFEACCENIEDSLCYFSPSFLAEQTELPVEIFEALARTDFSDNEVYKDLIERVTTIENFVQEAIDCDGMGHFLAPYDLKERMIGEYRLYRM
ncbi:MAG: hypothetical protein IKU15_06070 [Clostridia bacterium]|nr:hypothetical protein [Clostridia bacterium]